MAETVSDNMMAIVVKSNRCKIFFIESSLLIKPFNCVIRSIFFEEMKKINSATNREV